MNDEFHFTLDAAATEANAKCENYFTPALNGLLMSWLPVKEGAVFCNPPYGRQIGKWVQKAYGESTEHDTTIVMLLPARTDTQWFHEFIYGCAEIRFIKGRLRFTDDTGQAYWPAPFPSMVVIYNIKGW